MIHQDILIWHQDILIWDQDILIYNQDILIWHQARARFFGGYHVSHVKPRF